MINLNSGRVVNHFLGGNDLSTRDIHTKLGPRCALCSVLHEEYAE